MRVGLVSTLLWSRYGPFWTNLVEGVSAQPLRADAAALQAARADTRLASLPGLAFELAAAEALALAHADLLLVPELNPGVEEGRGSGQDPWIVNFAGTLRSVVAGLPPLLSVPADLGGNLESVAVEALLALARDPGRVRRVWQRHRAAARPPRAAGVRWLLRPSETRTVALVAQPWLLSDALAARLAGDGEHLVAQHRLDPASLRAEGLRADPRLIPTDAEVLGAARLFARRGAVAELRMVVDERSGADHWLLRRVEAMVNKPLTVVRLGELDDAADLLLAARSLP